MHYCHNLAPGHRDKLRRSCDVALSSALFKGLPNHTVAAILEAARWRDCRAHNNLCYQGMGGKSLFLLVSGSAKVGFCTDVGTEILLDWVKPPGIVGLDALDPKRPVCRCTVSVNKASEMLEWEAGTIVSLAQDCPRLFTNILALTLEWARFLEDRLSQLCSVGVAFRLARTVLYLDEKLKEQGLAEIRLSDEELGQMSGMALFTVNKILNRWKRLGYVHRERRCLVVIAPERLQCVC